ncbi:MAG: hypothetical protein DMF27_04255 [Verrucomicrobia bacterium]|nr:MAG: hypothetical protein DMF27_04255 [Verrucomicrobiota bacterium]
MARRPRSPPPRLSKKLRMTVGWTLDLLFSRDIEQMITLRDVEALSDLAGRIRARAKDSVPPLSPSEALAIDKQL